MFGPTGVGKSEAAELLAPHLPIEIINMDVGQFYVPLTIGTAKPSWQQSPIPHRLFDIIQEPKHLSVVTYRTLVLGEIEAVWNRGNIPVLVGGSGFYLMSLWYPPVAGGSDERVQGDWEELRELDPERAAQINPQDIYRIERALTIVKTTGQRSSCYRPRFDAIAPFVLTEFIRERSDLYERINARVVQMMEAGWIAEVERLMGTAWEPFLEQKKLIGYDDIIKYLKTPESERNYQQLIDGIAQKTRHYAKRQMTFGRMLLGRIQQEQAFLDNTQSSVGVFNLTLSSINLYINHLLQHPLLSKQKE